MAYRRQHLVSQVVIDRFCDQGNVVRFQLDPERIERRTPATCMYMPDFISAAPAEAEHLWSTVEHNLPVALAAIDDGSILARPDSVAALKDCLAVHVARSKAMAWTRERSLQLAAGQLKIEMITKQPKWLLQRFRRRYGLVGVGFQALERAADDFIAAAAPAVNTPKTFWASVRELFEYCQTFFARQALEIVTPEPGAGEYLIGDSPAVPLAKAHQLVGGPRGGVPVSEAATVVMPVGPKHAVALGPAQLSAPIPAPYVDQLNRVQVLNAFHEVCFRPGVDLDQFIRDARQLASPTLSTGPLYTPRRS